MRIGSSALLLLALAGFVHRPLNFGCDGCHWRGDVGPEPAREEPFVGGFVPRQVAFTANSRNLAFFLQQFLFSFKPHLQNLHALLLLLSEVFRIDLHIDSSGVDQVIRCQ